VIQALVSQQAGANALETTLGKMCEKYFTVSFHSHNYLANKNINFYNIYYRYVGTYVGTFDKARLD
jgi:hypothetical protein